MAKPKEKEGRAAARAESRKELYKILDKAVGAGQGRTIPEQEFEPVKFVPTGLIGVDWLLGGGVPLGRVVEIYGLESCGKTTLALMMIAQIQRETGKDVAYIDAEHTFDEEWARKLGVDIDKMYFLQPNSGEQAMEACEAFAASGLVGAIVLDSVAYMTPMAEMAGDHGDRNVGALPRLMAQGMRKITPILAKNDCTWILLNQVRDKIGGQQQNKFADNTTTPGGHAVRHAASIRIKLYRSQYKQGEERVGDYVHLRAVKNKVAPPFRQAVVPLVYGTGLDRVAELFDLALEYKLIDQRGAFYKLGDESLQGKQAATEFLRSRPDLQEALRPQVQAVLTVRSGLGLEESE